MKDDMSEFLKIAYAHNKVKDLHEAFEEYPVEEEWHHRDLEYVVGEDEKIEEYKNNFYNSLKENG